MIQELKIKNFKSFRDEVELSFEPSGEDSYNSVVTMPDGVELLMPVANQICLTQSSFCARSGTIFLRPIMTGRMSSPS